MNSGTEAESEISCSADDSAGEDFAGDPEEEGGQTQEQDPAAEAEAYEILITDLEIPLPEGGRIYDGTDEVRLSFHYAVREINGKEDGESAFSDQDGQGPGEGGNMQPAGGPAGQILCGDQVFCSGRESVEVSMPQQSPPVSFTLDACLESPDAGEQRVLFAPRMVSDQGLKIEPVLEDPDMDRTVFVAPKTLTVTAPSGKIVYGEKADMDHIWPEDADISSMNSAVSRGDESLVPEDRRLRAIVTGFARDEEGGELIPDGFEAPEVRTAPDLPGEDLVQYKDGKTMIYRNALVLCRGEDGRLSGTSTENYRFDEKSAGDGEGGSLTVVPRAVRAGEDFIFTGAALMTGEDSMIVLPGAAAGIALTQAGRKLFTEGEIRENCTEDGAAEFRLRKKDREGRTAAESLPVRLSWRVDGNVPAPQVIIEGWESGTGPICTSRPVTVSAFPAEDRVSGTAATKLRAVRLAGDGSSPAEYGEWTEASGMGEVRMTVYEEGVWRIEAESCDRAGNRAAASCPVLIIDRTAPVCRIDGVQEGSANSGKVILTVDCRDMNYLRGSTRVTISPRFSGKAPALASREETKEGIVLVYEDFERTREADACYQVTVTAKDLAGNEGRSSVSFSVNRFGSSYTLDESTYRMLESYSHAKPFDVTFIETNLSRVPEAEAVIRRSGRVLTVRKGEGLRVSSQEGRWMSYRYTVPAAAFTQDGEYEVLLMTEDQAGNRGNSSVQIPSVRFSIDRTAPEILISGISENDRIEGESMTIVTEVRDNLALRQAAVYVNSELVRKLSAAELSACGGVIKTELSAAENWQTFQVFVCDQAGNTAWSAEIPFYLAESGADSIGEYQKTQRSAQEIENDRTAERQEKTYLVSLKREEGERRRQAFETPAATDSGTLRGPAAENGAASPNRILFPVSAVLALSGLALMSLRKSRRRTVKEESENEKEDSRKMRDRQ